MVLFILVLSPTFQFFQALPLTSPKPTFQSPDFLAQKERLQAAADQDAYRRLLSPQPSSPLHRVSPIFSSSAITSLHRPGDIDGEADDDADSLTPSLVVNIFLSIILCGFSTYWALTHFQTPAFLGFASAKPSAGTSAQTAEPAFVLISIFAGLLVGVAEAAVYASYLWKVDQARSLERAIKEKKVIVGETSPNTNRDRCVRDNKKDGGREEIWGRGVNGGVRRRVREKWQGQSKADE
jgi:TMEM199 family protein